MQGGCVTEKDAWFIIVGRENYNDDKNKESYIIKYDMETMKEVKRSEKLKLGHANDVAFDSERNEIYVSHVYRDRVSILDADTLEVKETKKLEFPQYAIAYNQKRESFATALNQCDMVFYDKNFNVKDAALTPNTTLVTQGICADDKYVYHVLYSVKSNEDEPDNMIFVMDWDGNLITKIPIGLNEYEPENISLVDDTFYIGVSDRKIFSAKLVKAR